jgi:hypothetical protein
MHDDGVFALAEEFSISLPTRNLPSAFQNVDSRVIKLHLFSKCSIQVSISTRQYCAMGFDSRDYYAAM